MMAAYKQIGTIACYSCGEKIPIKENENGGLSFPCAWCDFPAYAKIGTQAGRIARRRMTALVIEEKPVPPIEEKPAIKESTKSIFGM